MTTYANPTTAPAGTRVYTVRGGYGADGTRVYATVTGYVHGGESIGVRYDNGATAVTPVSHKAYIVEDDRPATPEGRVTLAVQSDPAVAAAERAVERAERLHADASSTAADALTAAQTAPSAAATATYHAASYGKIEARHRLTAAQATLAMERANARRRAWQEEALRAHAAAKAERAAARDEMFALAPETVAPVETFTCTACGDAEHPVTPGDDDSLWCECGARLDEQRERVLDDMWAERAERAAGA